MTEKKTSEPLWWALFSAGGVVAAFLVPIHLFLHSLAAPLGWAPAKAISYERMVALVTDCLSGEASVAWVDRLPRSGLAVCPLSQFHLVRLDVQGSGCPAGETAGAAEARHCCQHRDLGDPLPGRPAVVFPPLDLTHVQEKDH